MMRCSRRRAVNGPAEGRENSRPYGEIARGRRQRRAHVQRDLEHGRSKTVTATDTVTPSLTSTATIAVKGNTVTTLGSSLNPSTTGQSVTFTATVTSGAAGAISGTVTFRDGATTLGAPSIAGSTATFTTSALTAGTHSITAQYNGSTDFNGSTSTTLSQTVNTPFGAPSGFSATATTTTNAMRAAAGLGAGTYTGTSLGGTFILAQHVIEMRSQLDVARASIGLPALVYSDSTITVGTTPVRAAHFTELRMGTQ
jgi:Big-like domain-containing protein